MHNSIGQWVNGGWLVPYLSIAVGILRYWLLLRAISYQNTMIERFLVHCKKLLQVCTLRQVFAVR